MTKKEMLKEKPLEELKALKQRIVELEALVATHYSDESSNEFEDGQKYRAVFESTNDVILLIDKHGKITDVNKRLKDFSGYEREELIGKNITSLARMMTKKNLAAVLGSFLKRMVGVKIPPYDVEMMKKSGESIIVEISAQPLMKNDEIIGDLVILRDVSERKQVEEALKTSEQNFRNLMDNSTMGIRIRDADEYVVYCNQALLDMFGYKNIDELRASPPQDHYTPASYAGYLLRKGKIARGEPVYNTLEVDIVSKDGTIRCVQVFGKSVLWNGKTQTQTFYNDITERKKIEEVLKESEKKYSTLIEQSADGIIILNDRTVEFANKMMLQMTGCSQDEILGKSFPELFTPEYTEFLNERYQRRQAGEKFPDNYELILLTKGNRKIYVETKIQLIEYKGRDARMVTIRDITEKKIAEEAVKESETSYHELVNTITSGVFIYKAVDNGEDFVFVDVNSAAEKMEGINRKDIIGRKITEVLPGAPEFYLFKVFQKVWQTGNTEYFQSGERMDERETGRWRDNWAYKLPSGEIVNVYNDITERKKIEEALKASEQNFRNSMENTLVGIRISDIDNRTLYANQALLDIFGYKNIGEVRLKSPQEYYSPESYAEYLSMREKHGRGEKIPDQVDIDIIRQDGAMRHLQALFKVVFWDGKQQYQTLYNDITERKQAEEALKSSEENFRNSMDSSLMGIRIMGDADYTLYANQALLDIFGYKNIDELRASPPQEHYTPESYASFVRRKEQFSRGESLPDQLEFDIIRTDGDIRHLQLSSKHVFWDGKQQFQLLYNDITERKQAEEALHESEEKYRLIVENSQDIIFTLDSAGEFRYVSPSVKQMLGYNQADLIGIPFRSLVHPEDWHIIEEAIQRGDEAGHHQYRFRHASGEWRWHASRGTKMLDTGGKSFNFTGISNDITERKQTEEALMLSEQNFRNSIDSSSVGIRISDIDNNTLYANQTLLDIFGYKNIDELKSTPPHKYYSPEYYADYLKLKERLLRGKTMSNQMEIDIVRQDGATRHLQTLFKEVFWDGKQQYQSIYTDITERKLAEEKLEQAAQEWRSTFDSITDLISIHDKDNHIVRVNKAVADSLKTTPRELIGKYCHEVMHGTKEPPANCPHLQTLKTGKPAAIEALNPNLDAYFHESSSPLFNDKGEITGSIIVARDVTQQKRIEEQLIMTDRLASIGELSSGIAHELNNPLTSVIGFSQLLMEGDVPENIKEDLSIVYSEAQRAAVIVKNLLTFARKHAPVKELCQVNTIIEDVLRLRTYEQKVNNIEVEKHLAANLPGIMIDYFQMQQVFLNIIVNAEFAMLEAHHKGRLTITTEKVDGNIRISFADDGSGISEENMKHIFDPFFTTKEVGKGTGLGLSICHGVITEHRGTIYARSEKGQGATFVVELPLSG